MERMPLRPLRGRIVQCCVAGKMKDPKRRTQKQGGGGDLGHSFVAEQLLKQ